MGYFRSFKIPDYNPFWEEPEHHRFQEEHWFWYHLGYDDGYAKGTDYGTRTQEEFDKLTQENEALRQLIGANVRVMKDELRKEMDGQTTGISEQQLQEVGDTATHGGATESNQTPVDAGTSG